MLLVYMATIAAVLRNGVLGEYRLPEWESRDPLRPLLVAPQLFDWVDSTVELYDGSIKAGGRTPLEHLEQMFCDLRCAKRPGAGDLRRVMPTKFGIWKLHPPLLRIYGWFYRPLHFAAVTGALASETKSDKSLNNKCRDIVRTFLKRNQLNETIIMGDHLAVLQTSTS